ncbi:hypothetical protein QVD17_18217 [Tagetes erecta]|uniref:Uncharacterized protein n=1 Tax=Tagetes erecta TaxID=13708 RepID=A0AAD8NVW2_TARER|nr:hypothetical protein QVD17_18217 [Tagetes erecta]
MSFSNFKIEPNFELFKFVCWFLVNRLLVTFAYSSWLVLGGEEWSRGRRAREVVTPSQTRIINGVVTRKQTRFKARGRDQMIAFKPLKFVFLVGQSWEYHSHLKKVQRGAKLKILFYILIGWRSTLWEAWEDHSLLPNEDWHKFFNRDDSKTRTVGMSIREKGVDEKGRDEKKGLDARGREPVLAGELVV